jgi:colicin import membrane protein
MGVWGPNNKAAWEKERAKQQKGRKADIAAARAQRMADEKHQREIDQHKWNMKEARRVEKEVAKRRVQTIKDERARAAEKVKADKERKEKAKRDKEAKDREKRMRSQGKKKSGWF